MNVMASSTQFKEVNGTAVEPSLTPVQLRITGIHEFLNGDSTTRKDRLITLSRLIGNQADMHEARSYGDWIELGKAIDKRQNLFRGFIVHTEDGRPAAYCVYYPMVDKNGKRAAYCEDIYVVEAWRGYGVFNIVLNELAKRTVNEGLNYVQWSTDARNHDFLAASHKKGIKAAAIKKFVCSNLLNPDFCADVSQLNSTGNATYVTRPLTPNDMYMVDDLGFGHDFITGTGEVDFRGFITFDQNDKSTPVAIIPGWKRLSTFTLTESLVLENARFAPGHSTADILLSVAEAASKTKMSNIFWHIPDNADHDLSDVLVTTFGTHVETMAGTMDSAMLTHLLEEPELSELANQNPPMLIMKKSNAPIGAKRAAANDVDKRSEGPVRAHHVTRSTDPYAAPVRSLRHG